MARLVTSGFELNQAISGSSAAGPEPSVSSGAATASNTNPRSGGFCGQCDSAVGNAVARWALSFGVSFPTTIYYRIYYWFDNLPSVTPSIFVASGSYSARVTSGGKLQLWNDSTVAQIGSDSVVTLVTNQYYRIEIAETRNASNQISAIELLLDGVVVATTSGLTLAAGGITFGWCTAPGASLKLRVDDVAVNDSTGTVQNGYPGEGKVVLLKPVSLNANGGSWTDDAAATTSAALFGAVDNEPPNGIADTTAGGGNHQDRNAAANTSLDMNMTDYTTAGVAATDKIRVVVPVINTSAPVVTGAKTGSVGVVSNPTITNIAFLNGATAAANFWSGTAAGTYPTGWKWEKGTTTYDPSVTPGTSPVMRVTITGGTTSRIAMVDFMGIYVEYSPRRSLVHNEVRRRNLQKMIGR